jgi:hypothetical protein
LTTLDPQLKQFATTAAQQRIFEAIESQGSARKAAKFLGLAYGTVYNTMRDLNSKAAKQGYSPDHDMKHLVPEGFRVKGVSTYYNKEGQPCGQWVKSTEDAEKQRQILEATVAGFTETLPRVEPIKTPNVSNSNLCNLVVFTDYHIGQLSYGRETLTGDWDLEIAEKLLVSSFLQMIYSAPKAETLVLCLQGDTLDIDSIVPVTPTHGNILDVDGRFAKIITVAIRVIRQLIDCGLKTHKKVHLIICQGNHDESLSIVLQHMFAALYEKEPRLTVNDALLPFYVYQHGKTMLAFHHGHKVHNENLPLLFASQYPKMWGETTKRYSHCGHRHHVDEKEYAGMTVIQHPTLSARNAYAARGGWISERAANIITYHKEYGQVARNTIVPEMFDLTPTNLFD